MLMKKLSNLLAFFKEKLPDLDYSYVYFNG